MTHIFRIEDSNPYAKSIVDFLKTLDFVYEEKSEKSVNFPTMTEKQIIDQAIKAEKEFEQGKYLSHEQAYQEFKKWK